MYNECSYQSLASLIRKTWNPAMPESRATATLWRLSSIVLRPELSNAYRSTLAVPQAGLMRHPRSQAAHFALLNIKAQMDIPHKRGWRTPQEGKGHLETERYNRDQLHRKGSILISREEQGMVSSNLVITSGWRTPSFPMLWPRAKISAHRPGKNAEPETERERKINVSSGGKKSIAI